MRWRSVSLRPLMRLCASAARSSTTPRCPASQDTTGACCRVDVTLINIGTRIERHSVTNEAGL